MILPPGLCDEFALGFIFAREACHGDERCQVRVNGGVGGASGTGALISGIRPFGIDLQEVPLYEETEAGSYSGAAGNHGVVELTFPNNRLIGIQRDIVVYREFEPKKDAIEYTQYIRVANQIENAAAYVHVRNVKVRP